MSPMHKLTRRAFATAAALTAAALATTLLPSTAQQAAKAPIKIGALLSLTGDLQAYGENCLKGIKLALDQINAAGGVLGSPIQVVEADDQTSAQPAIDAAQRLVNVEKVAAIIGALGSGITIPVATTVTVPSKIPQISPASTAPTITTLDDNDFLFRTVPSDAFQGVALAQITREEKLDRLAVIYINNDYGQGLADSFKAAFEKRGGKITKAVPYEPGKASYRGELDQLKEGNPQALVVIGYPENGAVILRQALEGGLFKRFVLTDGMRSPDLAAQVGADKLEGSIGTSPQARTDTKAYQSFVQAYEAAYGEVPPTPYIDTAYDAAFLLALAIQKAGSTDGTAIRDALRQVANPPGTEILPGEWAKAVELLKKGEDINYTGASGSLDFDEKGDVAGTFAHWTFKGGKIVDLKVFEPKS